LIPIDSFYFVKSLSELLQDDSPSGLSWLCPLSIFGVLALAAAAAVRFARGRAFSLRQLRWVEALLLAGVVAQLATNELDVLFTQRALRAFAEWRGLEGVEDRWEWSARGYGAYWAILAAGYGVLIPNTWRRCALMLTGIFLAPLLMSVAALWKDDLLLSPFGRGFLTELALCLGLATAVGVYGSHRISVLRQQVLQGRRLGPYQLKQKIGVGGMGEVYLAEHLLLRRPCALKLIRSDHAGDPTQLSRFEREVQTTATLTHPNTVQVYDYGHAEDGTFYYTMEYLPGLTLSQLILGHGPVPVARAVHFLRQLCGSLQEAHTVGLIHRDLKPGNVMVCERGGLPDVVKLLDFGLVLAKHEGQDGGKRTRERGVAGTPAYMSPEQAEGKGDLDARSDIYSLGCVAYFLLAGQPPFAARSAVRLLAAHRHKAAAPLSQHRADVPEDLQAIVMRCLAKDPDERFPSAHSLETALARCSAAGQWAEAEAAAWWRSRSDSHPK
jgi:serine/threonine-protein kinase